MINANSIAKLYNMLITWTTAIMFICSRGKDITKNTMLHMEKRHMLVHNNF